MLHVLEHAILDTLRLLPFLFLTYLAMEYLEHRAANKVQLAVRRSGRLGPLIGSLFGIVPQCGFSTAAANLYAGRVITMGTLIAVFLSTSDEMLPVLISQRAPISLIARILAIKWVIGVIAGFAVDALPSERKKMVPQHHIHEMCEHDHCHCDEESIFRSSLVHTLQIGLFILAVCVGLEVLLEFGGEEMLAGLVLNRPVLGPVLAGLIGLIPNCASSVAITQLYLEQALSFGALLSGLLVNAGVGLLVLFRVNHNRKENVKILCFLYAVGVIAGIVTELIV